MFELILATISEKDLNGIVKPLIDVLKVAVPVLLGVVGAIGALWVILLGVKYAKASQPQEHQNAKKSLQHAIVGFVLIFVLLIMLQVGLNIFTEWWSSYAY